MPDFFKYCPKCKSENISKSPAKNFTCLNCGFIYYHNVAAACAVIIEYNDKILFTVRKFDPEKGKLDLPGGFADYYENIEETIKREVKEELNLKIENIQYLTSFPNEYLYKDIKYHTLDIIFKTKLESIDNVQVNDDVQDYCLIKPNEINMNDIGLYSIKNAIQYYLKNIH